MKAGGFGPDDRETCIAELHAITTDSRLLGIAAGVTLGAWRANRSHDSGRVARMLEAAGADLAVRAAQQPRRSAGCWLTADDRGSATRTEPAADKLVSMPPEMKSSFGRLSALEQSSRELVHAVGHVMVPASTVTWQNKL